MSVWYLDLDDEITDAVARLRAARDERVVLVLPPGSRIATGRINFRLLAREAEKRHLKLAIVSGDRQVQATAMAAGLRVRGSVPEAESALDGPDEPLDAAASDAAQAAVTASATESRSTAMGPGAPTVALGATGAGGGASAITAPSRTSALSRFRGRGQVPTETGSFRVTPRAASAVTPGADATWTDVADARRPAARRTRRWSVTGVGVRLALVTGVVGFGLYGAWSSLPTARITIMPPTVLLAPLDFRVTADRGVAEAGDAVGMVPAQTVPIALTVKRSFDAKGTANELARATGTVRFTNLNPDLDFSLAPGTRVSTVGSGVVFRTLEFRALPRAPAEGEATKVDVPIEAVKAGPEGNVPADTIRQLPPDLDQVLVVVNNLKATSGGKSTLVPQVKEDDVRKARVALEADLDALLALRLADPATTPAGSTLYDETANYDRIRINWDPALDSLADRKVAAFELEATVTAIVIAVDEAIVRQAAADAYIRTAKQDGTTVFPATVTADAGRGVVQDGVVVYTVTVQGQSYTPPDARKLEAIVKGKSVDEVRRVLAQYGTVEVAVWPDFMPSVPDDEGRIEITIVPPREGAP